jgi:hypothetical protein
MNANDRGRFAALLTGALEVYRESPSEAAIDVWWWALSRYEFDDIRTGFAEHVTGPEGKFAPRPAHIIDRIAVHNPDGRPGADEAWAMVPKDDESSAVLTEEMLEALGIVRSMLSSDDVGARMAFRSAYERIVGDARRRGDPVRWIPSLGWEPLGRVDALRNAVTHNRMAADRAVNLLPPAQRDDFLESVGAHHLLPAPGDPMQALEARKLLAGMVARLAKPARQAAIEGKDVPA